MHQWKAEAHQKRIIKGYCSAAERMILGVLIITTSRKNIGNEKMGVGMALQKVTKQGRNECV